MKCLVYTFFNYRKNISKVLYRSNPISWDKMFLPNDFATKKLLSVIGEYDLVVGIADHNKNAKQVRFDPKYVNQYGKNILISNSPDILYANLSIPFLKDYYKYSSTTNGPCNRSAYLVMNEIQNKNLNTRFGFFHVPKYYREKELEELLNQFQ